MLRWFAEQRAARARARAQEQERDAIESIGSSSFRMALAALAEINGILDDYNEDDSSPAQNQSSTRRHESSNAERERGNSRRNIQSENLSRYPSRRIRSRARRDRDSRREQRRSQTPPTSTATLISGSGGSLAVGRELRRHRGRDAMQQPELESSDRGVSRFNVAHSLDAAPSSTARSQGRANSENRVNNPGLRANSSAIEAGFAVRNRFVRPFSVDYARSVRRHDPPSGLDDLQRDLSQSASSRIDATETEAERSSAHSAEIASSMNNNDSDMSGDERRWILAEILQLLGMHLPDPIVRGDSHLAAQFPTVSVEKGTALMGLSSCPICLEDLEGEVTLLPCFCSGHAECMKNAIKSDVRCPVHRIDVRKHFGVDPMGDVDSTLATDGTSNNSAGQNASGS